jgi:hypothetical protein
VQAAASVRRKNGNYDEIEARLADMMRPVSPPRDLVQRLRDRIHVPDREIIIVRLRDWSTLMMVLGAVMSGMVVVITVARAVFHLVGRRNV